MSLPPDKVDCRASAWMLMVSSIAEDDREVLTSETRKFYWSKWSAMLELVLF